MREFYDSKGILFFTIISTMKMINPRVRKSMKVHLLLVFHIFVLLDTNFSHSTTSIELVSFLPISLAALAHFIDCLIQRAFGCIQFS